jgi:hypothetical protein
MAAGTVAMKESTSFLKKKKQKTFIPTDLVNYSSQHQPVMVGLDPTMTGCGFWEPKSRTPRRLGLFIKP